MKKYLLSCGISLILSLSLVGFVQADPQVTAPVVFDLDSTTVQQGSSSLVIVMGQPDSVAQPNVKFAVDPNGAGQLQIVPDQFAGLVVLKGADFASVNAGMLGNLQWQTGATTINADDIVVLRTADNKYIKLDVTGVTGNAVNFDYQQIRTNVPGVPEPSTLVLLGIGLVGMFGLLRKQRQ